MIKRQTISQTQTKAKKPDITERMKQCLKDNTATWVEFSILAEKAYREEEWKKKGYENPKEYVEKELEEQISYEVFMHRVKMGEVINKFGLKKEDIVELGWSKFKEISSLALSKEDIDAEGVKEIVKSAQGKTFKEVADYVKRERTIKEEGRVVARKVTHTFKLLDEQDSVVKEAMAMACDVMGENNPTKGLVYICVEFLMNHTTNAKVVKAIKERVEELSKEDEPAQIVHKPHANKGKSKAKVGEVGDDEVEKSIFE